MSRRDALCVGALAVVAVALWLPRLNGPIDLRWDAAAYYELGTSLASGQGYRLLHEPGRIPSTLHPPLLPAFVALHQLAAGTGDVAVVGVRLRHWYMAMFVIYVIAVYALARRFLGPGCSFVAALLVLLHLQTVFMSDVLFPEILYALLTVLFALSITTPASRVRSWTAGTLAIAAFATRTVGIALLGAWILESASRRNVRQTLRRIGVAAVAVGAWSGYIAWIESRPEYRAPAYAYQRADYVYINVSYARNMRYMDPFRPELGHISTSGLVTRLLENLTQLPRNLGEAVSTPHGFFQALRAAADERFPPVIPAWSDRVLFGAATLLMCLGAGVLVARGDRTLVPYAVIALLITYSTPWPSQFNRYLSALAPFLALFLITGSSACARFPAAETAWRRLTALTIPAFVGVLIAAQAVTVVVLYTRLHDDAVWPRPGDAPLSHRLFFYQGNSRTTDAALDWLTSYAPRESVVAATIPTHAYLRTGLSSVMPPFESDPARAQQFLDSVPVSFLIVDEEILAKYTKAVVASFPNEWRRVFHTVTREGSDGYVEIYERVGRGNGGESRD